MLGRPFKIVCVIGTGICQKINSGGGGGGLGCHFIFTNLGVVIFQ